MSEQNCVTPWRNNEMHLCHSDTGLGISLTKTLRAGSQPAGQNSQFHNLVSVRSSTHTLTWIKQDSSYFLNISFWQFLCFCSFLCFSFQRKKQKMLKRIWARWSGLFTGQPVNHVKSVCDCLLGWIRLNCLSVLISLGQCLNNNSGLHPKLYNYTVSTFQKCSLHVNF